MKTPHIAIGLGGLLGFCAMLLLFSKTEIDAWPSSSHTGPSGLAALERLLEKDGYKTSANRSPLLPTKGSELIIAPIIVDKPEGFIEIVGGESATPIQRALARHAAKGGRLLQIQVPQDFNLASRTASNLTVNSQNNRYTIKAPFPMEDSPQMVQEAALPGTDEKVVPSQPAPLFSHDQGISSLPVARLQKMGKGVVISLDSGIIAVNRHLADENNADLVLELVRRLAPAGSEVVFAEASFGNQTEGGLGGALGSWFSAARNQAIILLITISISFAVRFGLRRPEKVTVRGARDMIDALAAQLAGTSDRVFVLKCLAAQTETEMKRLEGIGSHVRSTDLAALLPNKEGQVLLEILQMPDNIKVSSRQAALYANSLEQTLTSARQRAKERLLNKG